MMQKETGSDFNDTENIMEHIDFEDPNVINASTTVQSEYREVSIVKLEHQSKTSPVKEIHSKSEVDNPDPNPVADEKGLDMDDNKEETFDSCGIIKVKSIETEEFLENEEPGTKDKNGETGSISEVSLSGEEEDSIQFSTSEAQKNVPIRTKKTPFNFLKKMINIMSVSTGKNLTCST
jgi:hypothetical protein